jgi:hypothetical protein
MNFILGSGIIGYLAKEIFDWHIVPFKKSRYYTFEIPFADNYIVLDKDIDNFMNCYYPHNVQIINKSAFSFKGGLINDDQTLRELYVNKAYNSNPHPSATKLLKTIFSAYEVNVKQVHDMLFKKHIAHINDNIKKYGEVVSINVQSKEIIFKTGKVAYDNIISTIPLDALCKYAGHTMDLPSSDLYVYHLASNIINLEGSVQCYVCDDNIEFYKVQKIGDDQYLFWSGGVIEQPYKYFGLFFGYDFEILEVVKIEKAIPLGVPPDLSCFADNGIFCVGSNAQWDDFMDVSSCIKRLLRHKSINSI